AGAGAGIDGQGLVTTRTGVRLVVGYVVECYETFIVDEIRTLRAAGVDVVVFNAFRPIIESDPAKEDIRSQSLYFPERYRGVPSANIRAFARRPLAYGRLFLWLLAKGQSARLLALGAYYAALAKRGGIDHFHA